MWSERLEKLTSINEQLCSRVALSMMMNLEDAHSTYAQSFHLVKREIAKVCSQATPSCRTLSSGERGTRFDFHWRLPRFAHPKCKTLTKTKNVGAVLTHEFRGVPRFALHECRTLSFGRLRTQGLFSLAIFTRFTHPEGLLCDFISLFACCYSRLRWKPTTTCSSWARCCRGLRSSTTPVAPPPWCPFSLLWCTLSTLCGSTPGIHPPDQGVVLLVLSHGCRRALIDSFVDHCLFAMPVCSTDD